MFDDRRRVSIEIARAQTPRFSAWFNVGVHGSVNPIFRINGEARVRSEGFSIPDRCEARWGSPSVPDKLFPATRMPCSSPRISVSFEPFREPIERFEAALRNQSERIALREIGETFVLPW
jgi:hypothetical protein